MVREWGRTYRSYVRPALLGVSSRKVAFGTAVGGVAPSGVDGGVIRLMRSETTSDDAGPELCERALRPRADVEVFSRLSATRCLKHRRRAGEEFAGLRWLMCAELFALMFVGEI